MMSEAARLELGTSTRASMESDGVREVEGQSLRERLTPSRPSDRVAHEEPLEIQLGGAPLAVVMRTPGPRPRARARLPRRPSA